MVKLKERLPKIGLATLVALTGFILGVCGALIGFGVAYKTLDSKADTATLNAYRNENRIKDLEAITKSLELSAKSWSMGIDQIGKSMDDWKRQNEKEHDEIKAMIVRENRKPVSWEPTNEDYLQ